MRSLCGIGLLLSLLSWSPLRAAESFVVIVNASNPAASMSKEELSKLFLKKQSRWESGLKVIPRYRSDCGRRRSRVFGAHRL